MKSCSIPLFKSVLACIVSLSGISANAQYISAYDKNGNVRSTSDKAAEEARNKSNINTNGSGVSKAAATQKKAVDINFGEDEYRLYAYVGEEDGGLRPVRSKDNKWGYINSSNEIIIPLKYDKVKFTEKGIFGVKLNNKWGFVDWYGNITVPIIYADLITGFDNKRIAIVMDSRATYLKINEHGFTVGTITALEIERSHHAGYDTKNPYFEGLSLVGFTGKKKGYLDINWNVVIPLIYDDADNFNEGMASVKLGNKWGFINKTGQMVVPTKYDTANNFRKGLALVGMNGKYGYIDTTGTAVIQIIYDDVKPESLGYYVVKSGKKWGFLDKKGAIIFPFEYDDILNNFQVPEPEMYAYYPVVKPAVATVIKDYQQYTINAAGEAGYKTALSPKGYDEAGTYSIEGLASVKVKGKWGMIDTKGKIVIPIIYDTRLNILEGLIRIQLDNKYGYVDLTGKAITPLKYDRAADFWTESSPTVRINDKWGAIDRTGAEVVEVKYDEIRAYPKAETFAVKLNKKWGLVDKKGVEIIEIKYDEKCDESDMYLSQGSYTWFITKYGNEIAPFIYTKVKEPENGLIYFKLDGKFYPFDYSGKKLSKKMIKTE